jgi:hypothetical protein
MLGFVQRRGTILYPHKLPLSRRFILGQQFERGVPGEGEEVQARQHHRVCFGVEYAALGVDVQKQIVIAIGEEPVRAGNLDAIGLGHQ